METKTGSCAYMSDPVVRKRTPIVAVDWLTVDVPSTACAHLWGWCLGAILGATIVGAQAGELITNFTVAVQSNGAIGAVELAKAIAPYPTNTEAIKYCCNQYNIQVCVPTIIVKDASLRRCKPVYSTKRFLLQCFGRCQ